MAKINAGVPLKHNMTVDDLKKELDAFPGDARISGGVTKGDRPWESDQFRIEVRYET